ncbi:MAG TPA: CPBP family intramembrane glutamic endopeptidase [Fimbriimonadaceae bacterium]
MSVVIALLVLRPLFAATQMFLGQYPPYISGTGEVETIAINLAKIGLLIYLAWSANTPLSTFGFVKPRPKDLLWFLMAFASMAGVALVALAPQYFTSDPFPANANSPYVDAPIGLSAIYFLSVAILRETLFRGYLIVRLLQLDLPSTYAITFSAILFGSLQIYEGWLYVGIACLQGLFLGSIFLSKRTIWPLIAAHALYSFLAILFVYNHFPRGL